MQIPRKFCYKEARTLHRPQSKHGQVFRVSCSPWWWSCNARRQDEFNEFIRKSNREYQSRFSLSFQFVWKNRYRMFVWMDGMLCKVIAFFGLDKIFLPSSWNILKLKLSLSFPPCLLYCRISLYMINKFDNNISSPIRFILKRLLRLFVSTLEKWKIRLAEAGHLSNMEPS